MNCKNGSQRETVSLCMIVKNEEKFLSQCLVSVRDVVDEMIIVDTGSTDRTIEIAESFGAKVYEHPWQDSFSEARNYGLQFASCDWILQLDADEALRREDIPALQRAIQTSEYDAVYMALMNETPVGWTKHYFQRLFRNGKAKYTGNVHNQLVYSGPDLRTEIVIYHYGYNLSPEQMEQKFSRTKALLRKQLKSDRTNPFIYMNLVRVLKSQHEYKQVTELGETGLRVCKKRMTEPIFQMIMYDMVCSWIELGKLEKAEAKARKMLKKYPENLDMRYALGNALAKQKKFEDAKKTFHTFLKMHKEEEENPRFSKLIVDTYRLDHRVFAIIADLEYDLGNYEQGAHTAQKAIGKHGTCAEYYIAWARNLLKLEHVNKAKDVLADMENNTVMGETDYLKYAVLCKANPLLGTPAHVLKNGMETYPESIRLLHHFASYVSEKAPKAAADAWLKILKLDPGHTGALQGMAKLSMIKGDQQGFSKWISAMKKQGVSAARIAHLCRDFTAAHPDQGEAGTAPGSRPAISLCMIVKNEEEFLGQCLESVKDVVDEMIIVDTGSDDRTMEIAASFGAKVYEHPWQGSFSEARNYSLQYASCDWILQLDADEKLEAEDIPLIYKAVNQKTYDSVHIALLNDSKNGWTKHYFQRLFRRGKARYEGIVHNQLVCDGRTGWSEIRVYHYGYNLSKEKMQKKYERTESLLLKQIEADPSNPFAYQNYIRVLAAQDRFTEAEKAGKKALAVCKERMNPVNRQMISFDLAMSLINLGKYDEAGKLCGDILDEFPENLDILYALAFNSIKTLDYEEAITGFKRFLDVLVRKKEKPGYDGLIVESYSFEHRALASLSLAYEQLARYDKAVDAAEQAIEIKPEITEHYVVLGRALAQSGRAGEAVERIRQVEQQYNPDPLFYIKWAVASKTLPLGEPEEVFTRGLERFPENAKLRAQYALFLEDVDAHRAVKQWNTVLNTPGDTAEANIPLAGLYAKQGDYDNFNKCVKSLMENGANPRHLKRMGALCIQTGQYAEAVGVLTRYLQHNPDDADILADVATCYVKMEQYDAAVIGYRAALQLNSDNSSILANLERLEKIIARYTV